MIQAYAIGVDLVMDPRKVMGPLGQVLEGFDRLMKAQRDAQAGLNEFASGIRAATKATDALAAAWRNVASATQAAAAAAGKAAAPPQGVAAGPRSTALAPVPLLLAPPQGGRAVTLGWAGTSIIGSGGAGGGFNLPPIMLPPLGGGAGGAGGGLSMGNMARAWYGLQILEQVVSTVGRLVEAGAGFNDQLVKLQQRGIGADAVGGIADTAFAISQMVPGRDLADIVKDAGSLRSVLGEAAGPDPLVAVKRLLPNLEVLAAALGTTEAGGNTEAAMHMLLRAVENTGGATDPATGKISLERFESTLMAAYKALTAAGSVVKANDLLNLSKQGALIAKTMSPDDFFRMMLAATVDMGGARAGTAAQAIGRAWYGGTVNPRTAKEMEDLGMVPPGSYEKTGGAGGGRLSKNAINHLDAQIAAAGGLFPYVDTVLRPLLETHGFKTPEAQTQELFRLIPTDTARRLISLFLGNADQVRKEGDLFDKVPLPQAALAMAGKSSIMFNLQAMETSFSNFLQTVEKVNAPIIVDVLTHTRELFEFWSRVVEKDIGAMPKGAPGGAYSYTVPGLLERLLNTFGVDLGTGTSSAPGSNIHRESFRPGGGAVQLHGDIFMDGKKVGNVIAASMAGAFSAAPRGAATFDVRTGPALQVSA